MPRPVGALRFLGTYVMKRLVYLLPLVCLGFGIGACGDDGTGVVDTDNDTENDTDAPSTMSGTSPTTTLTTGMTMATESATEPTSSESSTGGEMCTPEDECIEPEDCPIPGSSCVACFCTGGKGCAEWGPGAFGDCVVPDQTEPDLTVCGDNPTAACVVNDPAMPESGICYFMCEKPCDCPQPPAGFEEDVECGDIIASTELECYIDCSDDGECPDGAYCNGGTLCMWGEATGVAPYGDCVNATQTCLEGICFPGEGWGWCTNIECADASECPDAPEGTAVPACEDLLQDKMKNPISSCFLDCSDGATCPTGMVCDETTFGDLSICIWELAEPGYGDCVNFPEAEACQSDETCQLDATQDPEQGVCAATDCVDPNTDCPIAPEGGDALRACLDVDGAGGDECVLDCTGGETCPPLMTCGAGNYCVWLDQGECATAIGDPSFESGSPNDAWEEASTNFGTPLCDPTSCPAFNTARTGDWYVWFGGVDDGLEVGSMTQDITIPAEADTLAFWLYFAAETTVNPELDNVEVLIDDMQLFIATAEDEGMYEDYTLVTMDVTAFADGGVHTLVIQSSTEGDEVTNILVDDVSLLCN
jgi:hypothetical protein